MTFVTPFQKLEQQALLPALIDFREEHIILLIPFPEKLAILLIDFRENLQLH